MLWSLLFLLFLNIFRIDLSNGETPAEWAVKWNGIGDSNNPSEQGKKSWRGVEITQFEREQLIKRIKAQSPDQVFADLLARPNSSVSYYGTCAAGFVGGMPTFWVTGMYGSVGHSGYPKNPESGDGTGHLKGCYNEHLITGLCSFLGIAERAKQTLLYAVENNICTNYYDIKRMLGSEVIKRDTTGGDGYLRARQYLEQAGLTIPPSGRGDKWITLCQVKARVRHSGWKRKTDEQSCIKTARGEIKETRVKVIAEWSCSYKTETYASGTNLDYQSHISSLYNEGMNLAVRKHDDIAVKLMETMKYQHITNIRVSTNMNTARLYAKAESAPFWGGGGNCDLVLEGRVNELY